MARRQCLISRSFISSNSSLLYFEVKVGPNHFGRGPFTGPPGSSQGHPASRPRRTC